MMYAVPQLSSSLMPKFPQQSLRFATVGSKGTTVARRKLSRIYIPLTNMHCSEAHNTQAFLYKPALTAHLEVNRD